MRTAAALIIVLNGERPMSWNRFYSGAHWAKRHAERTRVHQIVRASLDPNHPPYWNPVKITITAYFDKRPLDPDNIAAKLYIDGLNGWIINDDTMKHITSVTTRSRIDKKNPRVEIEILEMSAKFDELRDEVKHQTELADYWRRRYLEAVGGLEPGCKVVIGGGK